MDTKNTHDAGEMLQPTADSRLEDVTGFMQDLVGTLTCYVDQEFIAPKALPIWLAGLRRLEEHDTLTPENQPHAGWPPCGCSMR